MSISTEQQPQLYQQIVKAVEVFTKAGFTAPHTVEFQHKGSTLTLTWNSLDNNLLVEGQVSKYTSLAKGNVLKLNPTGSEHFAILLEVANMIPHLYNVCKEEEQRQKEYAVQVQHKMTHFLKSFK